MASKRQPWQRRPKESSKAFEAFVTYRDLGPGRSLAKVGKMLGKSSGTIEPWSVKWDWVERARSWDDEIDRRHAEKQAAEVLAMRETHAGIGKAMQGKGLDGLRALKSDEMTAQGVARLLRDGTTIERVARGEASEVVEVKEPRDLSNLTDEELEQLKALNRKARGDG